VRAGSRIWGFHASKTVPLFTAAELIAMPSGLGRTKISNSSTSVDLKDSPAHFNELEYRQSSRGVTAVLTFCGERK
jgi:hypothetical protein